MNFLRESIYSITCYARFIENYKHGISLEEDKGISLVLYRETNKKVAA